MPTEEIYPHDVVSRLANREAVTWRITDATCADLRPFCRAACCYDWTIGLRSVEEATKFASVSEPNAVDPCGHGQMRLGTNKWCVLNNPVTHECMRYGFRPSVCAEARCGLLGMSVTVTVVASK